MGCDRFDGRLAVLPGYQIKEFRMFIDNLICARLSHVSTAGDKIHFAPNAQKDALDLMQARDFGHPHVKCLINAEDVVLFGGLPGQDFTKFDNVFFGRNFAEPTNNQAFQRDSKHPDLDNGIIVENSEPKASLGDDFNNALSEQVEHRFSYRRPRNAQHLGKGRFGKELPARYLSVAYRSSDRVIGLLGQTLCTDERWHRLHQEHPLRLSATHTIKVSRILDANFKDYA